MVYEISNKEIFRDFDYICFTFCGLMEEAHRRSSRNSGNFKISQLKHYFTGNFPNAGCRFICGSIAILIAYITMYMMGLCLLIIISKFTMKIQNIASFSLPRMGSLILGNLITHVKLKHQYAMSVFSHITDSISILNFTSFLNLGGLENEYKSSDLCRKGLRR